MQIFINGSPRVLSASDTPLTLARMIELVGLSGKRIAVERNGEVIPKSQHAATPVTEGDRFEIIVAVGGG